LYCQKFRIWPDLSRSYLAFLPRDILLPVNTDSQVVAAFQGTSLQVSKAPGLSIYNSLSTTNANPLRQAPIIVKLRALMQEYGVFSERYDMIEPQAEPYSNSKPTLSDWLKADAWYRSRSLDLPDLGPSMVPFIDMANHAESDKANAVYDFDSIAGEALLRVKLRTKVEDVGSIIAGTEILLDYGEKSAAEFLFSYGFIDDSLDDARFVALPLDLPEDDPLADAKLSWAKGNLITFGIDRDECQISGHIRYIAILNEEDGLSMHLDEASATIVAHWKGKQVDTSDQLLEVLRSDASWPLFDLRSVVLVKMLTEAQLEEAFAFNENTDLDTRNATYILSMAARLRSLECDLLQRVHQYLEDKQEVLMQHPTILSYLGQ
jgi:hypothetical protein